MSSALSVSSLPWTTNLPSYLKLGDTGLELDHKAIKAAEHKRGPKIDKPKGYVDGSIARSHVSTARVLKQAQAGKP